MSTFMECDTFMLQNEGPIGTDGVPHDFRELPYRFGSHLPHQLAALKLVSGQVGQTPTSSGVVDLLLCTMRA